MRRHRPSKFGHWVCVAASLLLLAAAANAEDTVIQTSLLGRIESKRIAVGSSIFVKVVSDWKEGRCRLREGDTIEGRVVAVEHRTPTSKREQMTVRFLPLTCAGDESREIIPILVAIRAKQQQSDTSMLDRAALMAIFASSVGSHGIHGGAGGRAPAPSNEGARSMTSDNNQNAPLHAGEVRGFSGITLTLPQFTVDPTMIQASHEMLFDPDAQFFLVVRTLPSHPSAVDVASLPPQAPGTRESAVFGRKQNPIEMESCVETGCKLADLPALHTGGQLEHRLSLRSLGYKPRDNRVLLAFAEDAAVRFLGEDQLLVTFNPHPLIERSADDREWRSDPRIIRALVLSVHDSKVLHAEDWRVNQNGPYLWPLEKGRVLAIVGDTLTIFGPGLKVERQWVLPGPLALVRVSPSRNIIVAAVVKERHSPEEHHRIAEFMGPERMVEEDYDLTVLDGQLNVLGTRQLHAHPDIPAILDSGLLTSDAEPRSRWKVQEMTWDGGHHTVLEVNTPCPLHINSLPTDLILLSGCSPDGSQSWYRIVRKDGKTLLKGTTPGTHQIQNAVAVRAKGVFAVGIAEAQRPIDFEQGMYASEFRKLAVSVYSSTNGQRLFATPPLSGSVDRQSFALSEDGDRLAILSGDDISLYKTGIASKASGTQLSAR